MKVKICGITNYEDAFTAVSYGADALGFIFYDKSRRFVDQRKAAEIIAKLPFFVLKVGVFVNEHYKRVNEIAKELGLNAVQIHGDESPHYCEKITHPSIKAFRVNEFFDFDLLKGYNKCTLLLDTKSESEYGGTGTKFNWDIIPKKISKKIILAGGISVENIEEIREKITPQAIDVSSSVEKYPGKKDEQKLIEFLKLAKGIR